MCDRERTSLAIMRSFSKLIRPSTRVSLPRWINVKSFLTTGKNGICRKEKKLTKVPTIRAKLIKKTNHRRLDVLAVDEIAIFRHVTRRVHQILHIAEEALVFARQFLPRLFQPRDGPVAQPGDDIEHWIEILALFTLAGHFDELFDGTHPPHQIVLRANFRHDPKHFAIHQLSKRYEKKKINFSVHTTITDRSRIPR